MSDILYDFQTIEAAITDIQRQIDAAEAVQEDVRNIFNNLTTVYEGHAAHALHTKSGQVDNLMGEVLADLKTSQKEAEHQAELMHHLDQHNAAQFS
jgi:WXG100 family type VII secretion target